jgi:hypothetical protein
MVAAKFKSSAVMGLGLGLYFDRTPLMIPAHGLQDGDNFRISNGKVGNLLIGWTRFSTNWKLMEQGLSIINFTPRNFAEALVFLTTSDAYKYNTGPDTVSYLTPRYETGTASRAGTTVTGVGTAFLANVAAGDKIHFGASAYVDPTGSWDTVASITDNTHLETVGSGVVAGGAYTIRKLFHASKTNNWDYDIFVRDGVSGNDQLIITNGVDFPCSWDGNANQFTIQSTMAFKCKRVLAFKNMMLYGNLTNQAGTSKPMDMINSNTGNPFQAGASSTGLASQFVVHDGQDEILAMRKLGDMAVLYSERHCVAAQFVGSPLVFTFREAAIDVGPISAYVVADFGDYHEFLGLDTMYSFDGVSLKAINNHVGREMISRIDPVRKRNAFAHFNEERGEVYWSVPRTTDAGAGSSTAENAKTWTEHYLEQIPNAPGIGTPFSQRDFPFSCTGYFRNTSSLQWNTIGLNWNAAVIQWSSQSAAAQFPISLGADDSGYVYVLNTVQTGNGSNLNSYIKTGRRPTEKDGRGRAVLRRVYPYLSDGMGDLTVSLFMGEHAMGNMNAKGSFTLLGTQPDGGHFVSPFRRGRYMELQFGSPGTAWEIAGYDTDLTEGGMR